ncbi:MAG: YigZ family protein [Lachnospiraceae bacterium]|nr:YigZ family protein [Lachnospiraceae bacterium]
MDKIVYIEGEGEIVEKKSRFIGNCYPIKTEEEALSLIEAIRKKHYDARHHCYAYSIGKTQPLLRFSDDGEPQGTAGKPILEIITNANVTDCLIIVTRYFGGTLLGTGGLVRAYTLAAKEAINDATVVTEATGLHLLIDSDYQDIGKLQYIYKENDIDCLDISYAERVISDLLVKREDEKRITELITEATNGKSSISKGKNCSFFKADGKYIVKDE